MARPSRMERADAFYPVLSRGNERRDIVWDERDALICRVWKQGHFPLAPIAAYFGVGYTAIVNARQRGAQHLKRHPRLRKRIGKTE